MQQESHRVVCIGGGTGTFAVVSALKQLPVAITSVIAVSDSGGSTGRIRDEFGFQPVGDLRQSLAALADTHTQTWIQKLLLYRFEKGAGLEGHNLGNLILTALQDMVADTTRALEIAEQIFDLQGSVVPVTQTAVELKITYADGSSVVGEHLLDESHPNPQPIREVTLVPNCTLNPKAAAAIQSAHLICIGPGDLYASLMACLVVPGIKQAFSGSKARVVYVNNLMTRRSQSHNLSASEHAAVIERAIGKKVSTIVLNSEPIPDAIRTQYAKEDEHPVEDDLGSDSRAFRTPLASTVTPKQTAHDSVPRSLLRHDPAALASVFSKILKDLA